MKFSIGDKIILKRTGEEGHIVSYINQQMVEVEVNGTIFPAYTDEVDHPYLKWFTEKKQPKKATPPEQLPVEKEQLRKQRLAKGIYLSFLPVFKTEEMEDIVDHLKVYLLNELPQGIAFSYDMQVANSSTFRHTGNLHSFGHLYLHNVAYGDMNDQPRFNWQFTDPVNKDNEIAEGVLRIRPAKLFEHINELLRKNEPSFSYLLIEDFVIKQKPEQPEKYEPKASAKTISRSTISQMAPARYEVDLHIEHLVDSITGLGNAEIITIQLNALQRFLHLSIMHRQERIMVIHGLGKGKLRDEVHKVLQKTPEVAHYNNEWHGRYGFGATEVVFKY